MFAAFTGYFIIFCSCSGISRDFLLTIESCRFDRFVDEDVAPLDDGPSDDDILANTSDEEDDSSSISSKGDPEQPEESLVRSLSSFEPHNNILWRIVIASLFLPLG